MEHLVQILMPIRDNDGQPFSRSLLDEVRHELTEHFSGVTAHMRAPAHGAWEAPEGETQQEDVVIFEVMCERLDRCWWHDYRRNLETRFRQRQVLVRAVPVEKL